MKKDLEIYTDRSVIAQWKVVLSQQVDTETVDTLFGGMYSQSSLLAMTKDWNLFVDFCLSKNIAVLPASSTAVRQYLERQQKDKKYASLRRYSLTISRFHQVLSLKSPSESHQVQSYLAELRISGKATSSPTNALSKRDMKTILERVSGESSTKAIRDLAILVTMFECALKRSELRNLTQNQIKIHDSYVVVNIKDATYKLSQQASKVLKKWLSFIGNDSQAIVFRSVDRLGSIGSKPLNDSSIYRVIKSFESILGGEKKLSGQSPRVGAVHELKAQGKTIDEIKEFGRWDSPVMPYVYLGATSKAKSHQIIYKSLKKLED